MAAGMEIEFRLRGDILRAWNSRKYKVVGPVMVLHRVLELER